MAKPLLFITGFLGAGKTTLLRARLEDLKSQGLTADVILNDYENAEIDASTLPDHAASISPIAASCACCDSLDDLVKLCLAAQRSGGDVLLIELNGTADPLPLLETFTLVEDRLPFFPRWQVGVVDARHWGRRGDLAPLERRQVETATHRVVTHRDGLSETELDGISDSVRETNRFAKPVDASQLAAELAAQKAPLLFASAPSMEGSSAIGGPSRRGHPLAHQFTGYQVPLEGRYRRDQMTDLLEALPDEVVRAKALVSLEDAPGSRWLFQRTGDHPIDEPQQVDGLSRAPAALVCIGPALDPETLQGLVKLHSEDESRHGSWKTPSS